MDFIPEGLALRPHCMGAHGMGEIAEAVFGSRLATRFCAPLHTLSAEICMFFEDVVSCLCVEPLPQHQGHT